MRLPRVRRLFETGRTFERRGCRPLLNTANGTGIDLESVHEERAARHADRDASPWQLRAAARLGGGLGLVAAAGSCRI